MTLDRETLPATGTVLGIDVGYSSTSATTCFCTLEWDASNVTLRYSLTTSNVRSRREALVSLVHNRPLLAVALDGPLTHDLRLVGHYRSAEAMLSRGVLQRRGKPGQTSAPVGQQLHVHATALARTVLDTAEVSPSTHWQPIHQKRIVEAFPNLFLGALIRETDLPPIARDASDRYWDVLVGQSNGLLGLMKHMLPGRQLQPHLTAIMNHDHRAGVVCALTALSVAAGDFLAVGDPDDGDIILPPVASWGTATTGSGAWLESVLRENLPKVRAARRAHANHRNVRTCVRAGPIGRTQFHLRRYSRGVSTRPNGPR